MESEFKKHFNATGTKNRVTQNKQTKKKILKNEESSYLST